MVVETPSGTCKRISCEGNADELTKLDDLVEKIGEVLNE